MHNRQAKTYHVYKILTYTQEQLLTQETQSLLLLSAFSTSCKLKLM